MVYRIINCPIILFPAEEWLPIDTRKEQYLYPLFIKERINRLPEHFEMLTEYEYQK